MNEHTDGPLDERIELSDQDQADLERLYGSDESPVEEQEAPYFPLLRVWRQVLEPAAAEATKKVTPQWANRMVSKYADLHFADMNELRDRYFGKIEALRQILLAEIETDDEAESPTTVLEDLEQNAGHYKALLIAWQVQLMQWELEWTCTDPHAAAELAAIGEVHTMFFGSPSGAPGLVAHLENIRFEFTDADQAELAQALAEVRESYGEGS